MNIKTRYAPSPTGMQHIGGIRTALFNYLFAKANGGKFYLRIEDTDRLRYSEVGYKDIFDSINFLGLKYDSYIIQSERKELYQQKAIELVENGKAYKCFCTSERLDNLRKEQDQNKSNIKGYDGYCLHLDKKQIEKNLNDKLPYVIRLKINKEEKTNFFDLILKDQNWENKNINPDPVLLKSDGYPTYHLANIIDDHEMEISHVLRAQEWLSSTPIHILLYKAFNWTPPHFAHLPMVLGQDKKKLSKRHGSVAFKEFIQDGFLKEGILNYLTLLGFSFKDREFFLKEELEKIFNIENISKSPAIFDYTKFKFFNNHYIKQLSDKDLTELIYDMNKNDLKQADKKIIKQTCYMLKDRIDTIKEAYTWLEPLFKDLTLNYSIEDLTAKKVKTPLQEIYKAFLNSDINYDSIENIEGSLKKIVEEKEFKTKDFFMSLRIALLGSTKSLPLADSIFILQKEAIKRIENNLKKSLIDYI